MDSGDFDTAFHAVSLPQDAIPLLSDAEPLKLDGPTVFIEGVLLDIDEGRPEQGFDERFRRLWEFYFLYCEAGFMERTIGTVQMLLSRPTASNPGFVPQV